MEDRALEILRIMIGRQGLDTKTERVVVEDIAGANFYTIGKILVVFSQKDKGVLEKDVRAYHGFATSNEYTNGLIIVSLVPPSENTLLSAKSLAKERVRLFHIRQLQFDVTTHRMVMPHRILKDDERTSLFKKFNISKPEDQLPWIDSQDTMIKWIGALPGDIIEVTRHSDVAGSSLYYRYCVPDVNVA